MNRTKLAYVLPTYDPDSAEHLYHIYGFLEAAAKHLDIVLIVERAQGEPSFGGPQVYQRHVQLPVLRALEVLLVMLTARLRGFRRFYTHYSMSGAILSAVVTRVLGGTSYYWNCGHPLHFVPVRLRNLSDLRASLRNRYLLGLALHLVDHLVTGTETMAVWYSENYGIPRSSIRVMPNWVDLRRFEALPAKPALRSQLGWPADCRVVLFLHRLAERKGAQYIVPIAEQVVSQYSDQAPTLLFVVAGDGPYRETLQSEIQSAGLKEHFQLAGWVPNREVVKYFAAADVYMMPSMEEGFPRTLLEAMAAGCPFIASDVGGVRDVVTPTQAGLLAAKGDWPAMADALVRLLSDDTLREELAGDGLAHVRSYSQDKVVQSFVSLVTQ
ncbi:MAG: glycosyltransferase family 4 protein [Anaerolineales bacterium]|nr:MAG: glycosyltransferase family 4 protein [Anaerolineales bacterium]